MKCISLQHMLRQYPCTSRYPCLGLWSARIIDTFLASSFWSTASRNVPQALSCMPKVYQINNWPLAEIHLFTSQIGWKPNAQWLQRPGRIEIQMGRQDEVARGCWSWDCKSCSKNSWKVSAFRRWGNLWSKMQKKVKRRKFQWTSIGHQLRNEHYMHGLDSFRAK